MATNGIHRLSARQVDTAKDGDHADGGGLLLRVNGGNGSWVFRYTSPAGRRREIGLGGQTVVSNDLAATDRSLTNARDDAEAARRLMRAGTDPIEAHREERERVRRALEVQVQEKKAARATLARTARAYRGRVIEHRRSPKRAVQWLTSLENHMPDELWHKPIAEITAPELLDCILGLHAKIPETARRIRQRLEAIFGDAEFRGECAGNPVRAIQPKLKEALGQRKQRSFAALPFADAPAFLARLRERPEISARALEFAVLTAARTGEVIGARWEEFDLQAGTWSVPAERMKGGKRHVVYLPPRALEIRQADAGARAGLRVPRTDAQRCATLEYGAAHAAAPDGRQQDDHRARPVSRCVRVGSISRRR